MCVSVSVVLCGPPRTNAESGGEVPPREIQICEFQTASKSVWRWGSALREKERERERKSERERQREIANVNER